MPVWSSPDGEILVVKVSETNGCGEREVDGLDRVVDCDIVESDEADGGWKAGFHVLLFEDKQLDEGGHKNRSQSKTHPYSSSAHPTTTALTTILE